MVSNMRIFVISRGYPSRKYVINGNFEFDQAKALAARGHVVVYLAIDLRSIRRWRHWGRESLKKDQVNIEAINIPLGRIPERIFQYVSVYSLLRVFNECKEKYGSPDIIHAHFTNFAYSAVKALKKTNIPIVMTEHNSAINKQNINRRVKKVAQYVYESVDEIISVSPALQKRLKDLFHVDSTYIPNIVDSKIFSYRPKLENSNIFRIVTVGNLIPLKRMDRLIRGFSFFHREYNNSELVVIGDGPERKKLQKQVSELNLVEAVVFLGMCSREIIAENLKRASCFALVSSSETFGVAYIEALACGIPVIATTCGGPEGFVHQGNGILIPVDDDEALLQALVTMHNTHHNYNSLLIATEIATNFSPERVAHQLEIYYQRLIS